MASYGLKQGFWFPFIPHSLEHLPGRDSFPCRACQEFKETIIGYSNLGQDITAGTRARQNEMPKKVQVVKGDTRVKKGIKSSLVYTIPKIWKKAQKEKWIKMIW